MVEKKGLKKITTKIKSLILFFINIFIPKSKRKINVCPRNFYPITRCDLINYSDSNLFSFLNRYLQEKRQIKKVTFYIEYTDENRLKEYKGYARDVEKNNIKLCFLRSPLAGKGKIRKLFIRFRNALKKYSCKTWLCETGDSLNHGRGRLSCQKIICFNYFISCKNDLMVGWPLRWFHLDGMLTTSLLASQVASASLDVKLGNCKILGFPRNDNLFNKDKKEKIQSWLKEKIGYLPKNIILYAPTYRDYETGKKEPAFASAQAVEQLDKVEIEKRETRQLLGYAANDFSNWLKKNDTVFIYHLHPLQKVDIIQKDNHMIAYEESYDFTFYDLMAMADCLISDYSSISYDFLLLDRPLIFNLYDMEKYIQMRGVSYDPFEEFCPGAIVKNWEEMKKALIDVVEGVDEYKEHRARVRKLLHKYSDGNSTDRVIAYFDEYLKNLLG